MNFLREIIAATQARIPDLPPGIPERGRRSLRLSAALAGKTRVSVLGEVKRKSPSEGDLCPEVDAAEQGKRYEDAGAVGISVLTEPTRFAGSYRDLADVVAKCSLPVLMKDFLIDPGQVRVAGLLGASAALCLLRLTPSGLLDELRSASREYEVELLLECHDEADLDRALETDLPLIGINNRDLGSLCVDRGVSERLAPRVPSSRICIAESGYQTPKSLRPLRGFVDAVLVGTALMRAEDPGKLVQELQGCS